MGTFRKFKKQILDDPNLDENVKRVINQLQGNIENSVTPLVNKTQNDSTILSSISLTTGVNTISHKLGYPLSGWKIIDIDAAASVFRVQSSMNTSTFLYLQSSAPCTVSIEVF
jgi:hypothetical protein